MYDERTSFISFKKGGRTFKMKYLLAREEPHTKVPSIFLCSGKEFFKDLKDEEGHSHAIILKFKGEENIVKEPLPREVQALLEKYKDIVNHGASTMLPPRRVIIHQISFFLGAFLPNKETFKVTPYQNLEVLKKVQELLDQGLIQMSMSPCVVGIII